MMARSLGAGLSLGLVALAVAAGPALAANNGEILSLSAIGASRPGDPIVVNSSVQAIDDINQSNLSYAIFSPRGALVAVHRTDPRRMGPGDVFNDTWSTSNTPETGTYTVVLCWSVGSSTNCRIDLAYAQFYSVPTLGWPLTALGAGLIGFWIWRNRRAFSQAEAR
jgi:hypothetical protein